MYSGRKRPRTYESISKEIETNNQMLTSPDHVINDSSSMITTSPDLSQTNKSINDAMSQDKSEINNEEQQQQQERDGEDSTNFRHFRNILLNFDTDFVSNLSPTSDSLKYERNDSSLSSSNTAKRLYDGDTNNKMLESMHLVNEVGDKSLPPLSGPFKRSRSMFRDPPSTQEIDKRILCAEAARRRIAQSIAEQQMSQDTNVQNKN